MAEFDKHGPASSSGSAFVASSASTALDCSPSTSADPNTESCSGRLALVSHKVTQRDTLAGLAIRYNVSVGDIKRANGLLSDNALYARETIQIPTQGLPLGEELQLIFAQVATGFGRDPVLNAEANLHPASAAAARVARTLNIINGQSYPPDDINNLPWWCRCGTCDEAEDRGMCRSRQFTDSDDEPQEYEMQDRTGVLLPPDSAGPTRLTEHMRRRAARYSDGPDMDGDMGHGQPLMNGSTHSAYRPRGRPPRPQPPPGGPSAGGAALQGEGLGAVFKQISDFGKSLKDIPIIQKIKAAANQPALASGQRHSFSEAAEGVLGSFKLSHKLSKGPPGGGGSALTSLPLSRSSAGSAGTSTGTHRRKTGNKDD